MKKNWYKQGQALVEEIEATETLPEEMALWFMGQCGYIFKKGNVTFAIDPVLHDLLDPQGNTRRYYPAGLDPRDLFLDVIFFTHDHRDHLDVPTLKDVYARNPKIRVVAPAGLKGQIVEAGVPEENIVPMHHHEQVTLFEKDPVRMPMTIEGFRTAHPDWMVDPKDEERSLAFKISMNGQSILHLGDTYLCHELVEDLQKAAPVDVFLPPINGDDYFRAARNCIGNLSPYEAARAAALAGADMSMPCHYDMMTGNTCSPIPFIEAMEKEYPAGQYALPKLGARMILRK